MFQKEPEYQPPCCLDFVGSSWGAGPRAPSALCSGHAPMHVGWIVGVSRDLWTPAPVSFLAQPFMTGHLAYVWIKGQGQGWAGLQCRRGTLRAECNPRGDPGGLGSVCLECFLMSSPLHMSLPFHLLSNIYIQRSNPGENDSFIACLTG